jgi:hypothetical protein
MGVSEGETEVSNGVGPFWTEKLYRPSGGQDHLGLGSVSSDRILRTLVPGINVLTVHPRYWSFYSFVLDEFWRRRLARTRRSFAGFYRPCESIYAVASHLCDRAEHERHGPMCGVVGTDKARPYAAHAPAEFDPMYPYIDSDLGGYGLYYGTTMAATGLLIPALPQVGVPFDAPTPAGQRVAAAFREAIAGTAYYRDYFGHPDRPVPAGVVLEYARAACLCQLQTDSAPDRPLLRDVFCYGGDPEESAQRRASLRFFLDLSAVTDGVPVDQDMFRRLIYFRDLGDGLQYVPRAEVARTARRWPAVGAAERLGSRAKRCRSGVGPGRRLVVLAGQRPGPRSRRRPTRRRRPRHQLLGTAGRPRGLDHGNRRDRRECRRHLAAGQRTHRGPPRRLARRLTR